MKRVFSAWARKEESRPHCLVGGEGPVKFANGQIDPECQVLLWRIEASSWEEANAIYHLRQGWEPYTPEGKATPCPKCDALYYSLGSGQCWQCDHEQ